jgi:hypothetical protein
MGQPFQIVIPRLIDKIFTKTKAWKIYLMVDNRAALILGRGNLITRICSVNRVYFSVMKKLRTSNHVKIVWLFAIIKRAL